VFEANRLVHPQTLPGGLQGTVTGTQPQACVQCMVRESSAKPLPSGDCQGRDRVHAHNRPFGKGDATCNRLVVLISGVHSKRATRLQQNVCRRCVIRQRGYIISVKDRPSNASEVSERLLVSDLPYRPRVVRQTGSSSSVRAIC
jgi:hypothetical protein